MLKLYHAKLAVAGLTLKSWLCNEERHWNCEGLQFTNVCYEQKEKALVWILVLRTILYP